MFKFLKNILLGIIVLILIITAGLYVYYKYSFKKIDKKYTFLYIYPNMNINSLSDSLEEKGILRDAYLFKLMAKEMGLNSLKPGKYRITNKMNLPTIINILKYGKEEYVTINIHAEVFYFEDLISAISAKKYLTDKLLTEQILSLQKDKNIMNYLLISSFNTSWAVSSRAIYDSIQNSYYCFWTQQKKSLLKTTGLTETECMILASIVQHESSIFSEQKKIAGVYINRLKAKMPLQADPTLKYINHKMSASRLYNSDKEINSPYNTYKYSGLPPTTLGAVSIQAINAVLNFERHNYLYFCAKPEMNGYSNYSKTFDEHLKCARQYQQKLNKLNIQ